MKQMNKWFFATIGTAVALVVMIIVAIVLGVNGGTTETPELPEGPETGIYYFNADSGEYTLHLHSGNQFTLDDGVARVGKYTVSGDTVSFDFTKDSNGEATAKLAGNVLTLTYNNQEIRFLKKVNYTVTFEANGGDSSAKSTTVLNGKTVTQPEDPTKEGNLFVGWYSDKGMTTPYVFGSSIITADTTLYAKWVEKAVGQVEYTVDFEGADVEDMTTFGGKLYNVPNPQKEGYTFGGWWISDYEDGEKLTTKYTDDTVFEANTTLFAVWVRAEGDKLAAPLVDVTENGLSWTSVGASTYAVKITAPDGTSAYNDNVSSTTLNFDFSKAGGYVIEVTAVATNTVNNSDTTVRYYNANALNRVSLFTVVEPSTVIFNSVGADKYYITVKCGNANHKHTMIDNGKSTVFSFVNCDMKEGGIEFTVTAVKNGYAQSVSETFVCERKLDKVTEITVDKATETVVWTPVKNAAYYAVSVTVGGNTLPTVYVTEASYSLKGAPAGDVTVKVTPVTTGYLSAEATGLTYTKTTISAPAGLEVNGTVISWDAVAGATSYTVKVGAKEFKTEATVLDLTAVDATFANGEIVAISVKASANDNSSVYSDEITAKYNGFIGNLVYSNGVISWSPAIGEGSYDVAVNGEIVDTVTNANSYALTFKAAGTYTVSVTFVSAAGQEKYETDITVYAITFDSRLGTGVETVYVTAGDLLNLPTTSTRPGYTFSGWYNTPVASKGNGKLYSGAYYGEKDSIILYADWTANTYYITQEVDADVTGTTNGNSVPVVYGEKFTLPVVGSDDGAFLGWYSGPGGTGVQLTDARGESVGIYTNIKDITAHPYFALGVLDYFENKDGTYSVTGGYNIKSVIDLVIPDTYNGKPITAVLENAFKDGEYNIKTVSIPNTVTLIGTGALETLYYLEYIDVREVEGNHEVIYSSSNGALIRNDLGVSYLELFPRRMAGEYTVPDTVDSIRNKAFYNANYVTKLNISKEVTYIADEAFYNCARLEEIVFEEGGTSALTIEPTAFYEVKKLTSITLPARLENFSLETFDVCIALENINAEAGGKYYGSVDGMLTNGAQDTILYCPVTRTGDVEIPASVLAVGEGAFAGRTGITSVKIHNKMTEIAKGAFEGCGSIKTVTFEGGRNVDLVVGEGAFKGNGAITSVRFEAPLSDSIDRGAVTIGTSAFEDCKNIGELYFAKTANVEEIAANAFKGCTRIATLEIPATTARIGDSAFAGCIGIRSVILAEGGVDIEFGSFVFSDCAQLTSISIPATVTVFDGSVFEGCDNIAEIIVDKDNPALVAEDGVLYDKAKTEIMYFPRARALDLEKLPTTLTKIGAAAFQSNPNIVSITIPAGITEIGANAFDGCIYLSEVKFDNTSAITIGDYAFANCPELIDITLPKNLTEVGDYAFYQSGLGKPAEGETAFGTIVIPNTVTYIGEYAFAYTMIGGINIPANVEFVGEGAFYKCKNFATFTVEEGNKALTIGSADDEYGVFEGTILETANLSTRTAVVGVRAFYGLTTLTNVNIPTGSKLTTIGDYAFSGDNFTEIALPEGLVSIGVEAFANITTITSVTIPSTVEDIGEYAFANMPALTTIEFAGADTAATPLSINDYAFANNASLVSITLPKRLERVYDYISVGTGISLTSFYTVFDGCNKLENIFVSDGCVQFSDVDGVFYSNDMNGKPANLIYCPKGKTGEVTVPSTVTLVSNLAFADAKVQRVVFEEMDNWNGEATLRIGSAMSAESTDFPYIVFGSSSNRYNDFNPYLKEVVLPAHLASVGSCSFQHIGDYDSDRTGFKITFNREAGPVEFGEYAIANNYGLLELYLPKVASVPENSFTGNSYMTVVSFGKGSTVEKIGYWSFTNGGIEELYDIPASVKVIDSWAFGSNSVETITFEEGSQLHTIGDSAFSDSQISSFVFPDTLEVVGGGALGTNLVEVTLNSVIKSTIAPSGSCIFGNCGTLKSITLPDDNPYMELVDGALYSEDMTVLMYVPPKLEMGDRTAFDIDDRVTSIEASAFCYFPNPIVLHEGILRIGKNAFTRTSLTEVTIPASVTEIAAYAFSSISKLTTVRVAANPSLTTIGDNAFYSNISLVYLELPDSVTEIGKYICQNSTKLESIDIPAGVTYIPTYAFLGCTSLKDVTLHEGLKIIGASAFARCAIETITIPASVVEFEDYYTNGVFEECRSMKEITFAEGCKLTNIPGETFNNCSSLESIALPNNIDALGANAFLGCTALKNVSIGGSWTELPANFLKGITTLETVVLHDGVKTIGTGAFDGCINLKSCPMPASLETVGEAAFRNCASLGSVTFGEKVETIGNYAFDGCSSLDSVVFAENCTLKSLGDDPTVEAAIFRGTTALKSIVLPDSVTGMGANVFENSGLSSVDLPANLSAIGDYAFAGCANLTSVEIPSTVKSVGNFAFENCSGLVNARLYLGVQVIGTGAFANCVALDTVNVPSSVITITGNPFINCPSLVNFNFDSSNTDYVLEHGALMDAGKFTIIYYLPTNEAESYEIPETVGVLAAGAFCDSQLTSISIPEKIVEIPSMLFMNSKKLETVKFTNSISAIGSEAFKGCIALTEVTIPEMTASVGDAAFEGCSSLKTVNFTNRTMALSFGARIFKDCTSLSEITLPEQLVALTDYMLANTAITEFNVPASVTSLDVNGVLANCSQLKTVNIHTGVKGNLGAEFFMNCTALKEINLPAGITTIGLIEKVGYVVYSSGSSYFTEYGTGIYSGAFKGCTSITSIDLSHVTNIGANAFEGCTSLTSIKFAEEMHSIGDYAFAGCTALVELNMYDQIKKTADYSTTYKYFALGAFAFADCTGLEKISLPGDYVHKLKDGLFKGCTSLEFIDIYRASSIEYMAKPFDGLTDKCVVYFSNDKMNANSYLNSFSVSYDQYNNKRPNLDWLQSTDALFMDCYGTIILHDSAMQNANLLNPVVSAADGTPISKNWSIGDNGFIYSWPSGYWDIRLPDGTIMLDESYLYDEDGSIYSDFEGEDTSDDYYVNVKDGVLSYPDPAENSDTICVVTDTSLFTVDEEGYVTFSPEFDPLPYRNKLLVLIDGDMTYVLRSQWHYEMPGSYVQVYGWFAGATIDAEGNVFIRKSTISSDYNTFSISLVTTFNADGSVDFFDGTHIAADGNISFDCGVTFVDGVLVTKDGREFSDDVIYVYEDGTVRLGSLNYGVAK